MARKTYKVIGPFVTHETEPGGTFTANLDEVTEARLLEQGAVEIVKQTKADEKAASTSSGASESGGGS